MDNISKISVNGTMYGIVDTITTINGQSGAIVASDIAAVLSAAGYKLTDDNTVTSINGKTGAIVASDIASVLMAAGYELTGQVNRSEMGVASGVATLDANGHVPSTQILNASTTTCQDIVDELV